ncbi:Tex family protein [Desulfofalx alkaliphila]|uniref:Tex family protein n=1 Tax=Desulfofalx alkaliphila TaxID=105483 RepID=UPI000A070D9B|nr:Tex family protein [Desulfofalx alkaliphila]
MDNHILIEQVASATHIPYKQVLRTVELLDEGNTVPFISRYRKEVTGELSEVQVRDIEDKLKYFRNLAQRKQEVLRLIDEQGKLTTELRKQIESATKIIQVEDLYRPYRQKRRTRASVAKEKGLEPLVNYLLNFPPEKDVISEASRYINKEKGVNSAEDALQGAQDIIAEMVSDDAEVRGWVRQLVSENGILLTAAKDNEVQSVYQMYYEFSQPVNKLPPHRILAINRGEREGFLKVKIEVDEKQIIQYINKKWLKTGSGPVRYVQEAVQDSLHRLILPAVEREVRNELTERAEEQAIKVFSKNLQHLLLQAPVRDKMVLGVDPAYRTGCKWAVVDDTGKLLEVGVVYPTPPQNKVEQARKVFTWLADKYNIEVIAIGNGTASRETEQFVADFIKNYTRRQLHYLIVSEAGASVYSASELAGKEFAHLDVAERSAVSIARRFQDPMAELVKIDPKSLGVGQYQHDVNAKKLEESLSRVVESAVNHVGVDLNTASPALLSYVAGVNSTVAKNLVNYRTEIGRYKNRSQLKKVPRLGPKTYQQCVGFLRVFNGDNPLDKTPIHPESYDLVKKLLKEINCGLEDVGSDELRAKLAQLDVEKIADKIKAGVPTLKDIIDALMRPGRDPREELPRPILRTDVLTLNDLKQGMELKGTVRNVVDFGAFVDIGVGVDGLVHISQLTDKYIKHPLEVVSLGDVVEVKVLEVDTARERVSLTMKV